MSPKAGEDKLEAGAWGQEVEDSKYTIGKHQALTVQHRAIAIILHQL